MAAKADGARWQSAGSWLYLIVAGSLVGYTCYVWLLHATTPARVATYAYVNPFVAVLLGCTIGREAFSHELLVAGHVRRPQRPQAKRWGRKNG